MLEKTDQPGGRVATQIFSTDAFDTGAQYFTVRDDRLRHYVQSWQNDGIVQPWKGKVKVIKAGQLSSEKRVEERWVGTPAMNAIPAHLAAELDIYFDVTVVAMATEKGQWQLIDQHDIDYGPFDVVIIAAPPDGITRLLKSSPKLFKRVAEIEMQPCLAVMAAFEKPLDLPFDAAFVHKSPLRWVARNNSKPQRPPTECWVFHADVKCSKAYTGHDDNTIVRSLLDAFFEGSGHPPADPIYCRTRYWRSAAASNPLNVGCLWDEDLKIGLCGDWCQMSRLEGAVLSGMAISGRILSMSTGTPGILEDSKN